MIEPIPDLPRNVVGFRAKGHVTASDYREAFAPAVEATRSAGGKLRLLYVAGPEFEDYEIDSTWEETRTRAQRLFDFERIAFVSDTELYGDAVHAFGWRVPAEAQVYPVADLERAVAWVSE